MTGTVQVKIIKRPFPQVQARGVYLTERWDGAWNLSEMGSTRVNEGGLAPQAESKISS
jgi:hypothetical protein